MRKLHLLFTKDGLQLQVCKGKTVEKESYFFLEEGKKSNFILDQLKEILSTEKVQEISIISAINHFSLQKESFTDHEMGLQLINLNSDIAQEQEELMLTVNKKYGLQFYYSFPQKLYRLIKEQNVPTQFNFSGEEFLQKISCKNKKEIHINLYHHQCEFIAMADKKLVLYNNLDINSEVDFLYFVMFTLSKINFGLDETKFIVYGETSENATFISELQKFVKNLSIVFDNIPKQSFLWS